MVKISSCILAICIGLIAGCSQVIGGYVAVSTFSQGGFARNPAAVAALAGQDVQIWGFVDHGNLYGNDDARAVLGNWWSGDGPDENTWRFNLKANANDETGRSFAVHVPGDEGRDALLALFAADAATQTPTRVFVKGRLYTFDAPGNVTTRTGLYMEAASSADILPAPPARTSE